MKSQVLTFPSSHSATRDKEFGCQVIAETDLPLVLISLFATCLLATSYNVTWFVFFRPSDPPVMQQQNASNLPLDEKTIFTMLPKLFYRVATSWPFCGKIRSISLQPLSLVLAIANRSSFYEIDRDSIPSVNFIFKSISWRGGHSTRDGQ